MILTIDLGTTFTKVCLWDPALAASGRARLVTTRPHPGWEEQDPSAWWGSVVAASESARREAGVAGTAPVSVVACCGARQTFVTVDAEGEPTGPGILWSDRRAADEVDPLAARAGGADAVRHRTGAPLAAESVAAKLAWLGRNRSEQLSGARWVLTPRDLVVHRLCGEFVTDHTMASRSGLYDEQGSVLATLAGPAANLLPPVVASDAAVGVVGARVAAELGVPSGIPVVIGAGDRACEVVGTGASAAVPMVSWGTTASVVVPSGARPDPPPEGLVVSRAAIGSSPDGPGWLSEGGLSAAGALLDWLAALCDRPVPELLHDAAGRSPGANGVVALPWLGGARAPWWRDGARAGFVGARPEHDAVDLARAAVEAVAADVSRCLVAAGGPSGPFDALTLGGRGRADHLWPSVLAAVCDLPVRTRRSGEAASAGAAWLAGRAVGDPIALDDLDPPAGELEPDPAAVDFYARWRAVVDPVAETLVDLDLGG